MKASRSKQYKILRRSDFTEHIEMLKTMLKYCNHSKRKARLTKQIHDVEEVLREFKHYSFSSVTIKRGKIVALNFNRRDLVCKPPMSYNRSQRC